MGQLEIVTIGSVFILSDVFLGVAVIVTKAPFYFRKEATFSPGPLPLGKKPTERSWERCMGKERFSVAKLTLKMS